MKKRGNLYLKKQIFLSCLLALVFILSVPVVSKVTVYDGCIGPRYCKCTVNGSTSNLYSKIKYDVSTSPRVIIPTSLRSGRTIFHGGNGERRSRKAPQRTAWAIGRPPAAVRADAVPPSADLCRGFFCANILSCGKKCEKQLKNRSYTSFQQPHTCGII